MDSDKALIRDCTEKAESRNDDWNLELIKNIKSGTMTHGDRNYLQDYLINA